MLSQCLLSQKDDLRKIFSTIQNQVGHFDKIFNFIKVKTGNTQMMLQKQVFAQRMLENLINDLLDLSQLESNSFSLARDYFNLTQTVYEAF